MSVKPGRWVRLDRLCANVAGIDRVLSQIPILDTHLWMRYHNIHTCHHAR